MCENVDQGMVWQEVLVRKQGRQVWQVSARDSWPRLGSVWVSGGLNSISPPQEEDHLGPADDTARGSVRLSAWHEEDKSLGATSANSVREGARKGGRTPVGCLTV